MMNGEPEQEENWREMLSAAPLRHPPPPFLQYANRHQNWLSRLWRRKAPVARPIASGDNLGSSLLQGPPDRTCESFTGGLLATVDCAPGHCMMPRAPVPPGRKAVSSANSTLQQPCYRF